jgi:hypothetical protein
MESLLELALRTEERVSARSESGRAGLRAFFGISRLTSAVLRQLQDLRETAPKHVPRIEVVNSFDNCSYCHKTMKTEGHKETD